MKASALLAIAIVFSLLTAPHVAAQGNSWDKVRYCGGTVATKTDPDDWHNTLTVTSEAISLKLKDGQTVVVDPAKVSTVSYGQEAHRRVGTMIALGILVAPVALFGLFHKTKKHYIGMDYETAEGKRAGILMQGDKDNFRAILLALSSTTGKPVAVDPKDRSQVPANVAVTESVTPEPNEKSAAKETAAQPAATGVVKVEATTAGADVYVDGNFVGNVPAQLKLAPGKHTIKVTAPGHQDWSRELEVMAGSEVSLKATLIALSDPSNNP